MAPVGEGSAVVAVLILVVVLHTRAREPLELEQHPRLPTLMVVAEQAALFLMVRQVVEVVMRTRDKTDNNLILGTGVAQQDRQT